MHEGHDLVIKDLQQQLEEQVNAAEEIRLLLEETAEDDELQAVSPVTSCFSEECSDTASSLIMHAEDSICCLPC